VAAGDGSWVAAGGILGLSARRGVRRWCVIQWGNACLLHAPAPVVGVVVWFTPVVRLFLGGVWCGGRGDLDAWRTSSLAPLLAEVWRLLQSLVGHG
jgi:cytochrome c-type biogenesis protein CcmH/NrfF